MRTVIFAVCGLGIGVAVSAPVAGAIGEPQSTANPYAAATAAGMRDVTFPSGALTLHGGLYMPPGPGPRPAVLYNHGSGKLANRDVPELGRFFTAHGYVLFIPHRRGHGRSGDAAPFMGDLLDAERDANGPAAWSRLLVKLHETDHLSDQLAALAWLQARSFVDRTRIVIAGCSFGGIQTVLASERDLGVRAALDFAGAAQTWANAPDLQARLKASVRQAKVPIFFLQAENDYDTTPSRELALEMERAGRPHQVKIYAPFGKTHKDGHGGFCRSAGAVWGADVFRFIESSTSR